MGEMLAVKRWTCLRKASDEVVSAARTAIVTSQTRKPGRWIWHKCRKFCYGVEKTCRLFIDSKLDIEVRFVPVRCGTAPCECRNYPAVWRPTHQQTSRTDGLSIPARSLRQRNLWNIDRTTATRPAHHIRPSRTWTMLNHLHCVGDVICMSAKM